MHFIMMMLLFMIAVCFGVDILLSMAFLGAFFNYRQELILGVGTALTLLYIVEIVLMCFFWHRAWRSIRDGHARTTPGKAIGFMFIPLFNLWWVFVLLAGFASEFNAFCRRHTVGNPPRRLPVGYFRAVAILWVAAVALRYLPVVGGAVNAVVTLPRAMAIFIRYTPAVGAAYNSLFMLAFLVALYKTARAVTAVYDNHVMAISPRNAQ